MSSERIRTVTVDAASSGNNTILAAATGKQYRIKSFTLTAASAVTTELRMDTLLACGPMTLAAGIPHTGRSSTPRGIGRSIPESAIILNLSGAVQVSGTITYYEDDCRTPGYNWGQGLVFYAPYADSGIDLAGSRNMTAVGTPAHADTIIGRGLDYHAAAASNIYTITKASFPIDLTDSDQDFTWSTWLKSKSAADSTGSFMAILYTGDVASDRSIRIWLDEANTRAKIGVSSNGSSWVFDVNTTVGTFPLEEWVHLCWAHGAYDSGNGTMELYLNGAQATSQSTPSGYNSSAATSNVAFYTNNLGNGNFQGQIAENAWWNKKLTSTEVAALYAHGLTGARVLSL